MVLASAELPGGVTRMLSRSSLTRLVRHRMSWLSRVSRTAVSWWLVISMLSAPGAGAVSMLKDLASTPAARVVMATAGRSLQLAAGQLPRIGVTAGVVALVSGVFGLPESDPS